MLEATGRVIEEKSVSAPNQTIRLGEKYTPGTYILQVTQGTKRVNLKLIKLAN